MRVFILFALLVSGLANAQLVKNVGDFDALKVFDGINVELIPSDRNRVEVSGRRSDEVELVNRNGELKIRMSLKKLLDGEDISARVYFTDLKSIDAAEGSFVGSGAVFSQPLIELTAKTGAEIKLALEVKAADVKAVTGGIIRLNGSAESLVADLGTGGILWAKTLQTRTTQVEIKAGGDAEVRASTTVSADVKAGGNITIFGKPQQINQKTTLGGTIRESND